MFNYFFRTPERITSIKRLVGGFVLTTPSPETAKKMAGILHGHKYSPTEGQPLFQYEFNVTQSTVLLSGDDALPALHTLSHVLLTTQCQKQLPPLSSGSNDLMPVRQEISVP